MNPTDFGDEEVNACSFSSEMFYNNLFLKLFLNFKEILIVKAIVKAIGHEICCMKILSITVAGFMYMLTNGFPRLLTNFP